MATITIGTNGTTTLTGLQFQPGTTPSDADIATICQLITNDQQAYPGQDWPGAWARTGILYVPNRGILKAMPGDYVAVDPVTGWPILLSSQTLPTTLTRTGTPVSGTTSMVLTASAIAAGWKSGTYITGTGLAANTQITTISSDGLTVGLSTAATSSPGATTITASNWTHS